MTPTQAIAVLRSIQTHDAMQAEALEMAVAGLRDTARLENELARTRAHFEHGVQVLTGIHALLYPPKVTNAKGVTFQFKSPYVHDQMQALSDRIRAIPDALDNLRAAVEAKA